MAYVVGLMATDGCLVNDNRHLVFTTCDRQLAEVFLECLGSSVRYQTGKTAKGNDVFRVQLGDVALYRWLETIGLHQRKSLTLGAIDVPKEFLADLVRGLLDGDGTIANFVHRPTLRTYPDYLYERLQVRFGSASRAHLEWLRGQVRSVLPISAAIIPAKPRPGRHAYFNLAYAKHASLALLSWLYADPAAPRLLRKWQIWESYRLRHCAEGGI